MFNFQICAYLRWLLSSRLQLEEQTVLPQTKLSLLLWLRIFMCWKLGYYILGSAQQKSTLLELILNSEHHRPVSLFYDFLVNKMVLFPWEGDMLRNFDRRKGHKVLKKSLFFCRAFPFANLFYFLSCYGNQSVVCMIYVQVQKSETLVEQDPVSTMQKTGEANYSSFLEWKRVPPWMWSLGKLSKTF